MVAVVFGGMITCRESLVHRTAISPYAVRSVRAKNVRGTSVRGAITIRR
jgi:hypothetical protein